MNVPQEHILVSQMPHVLTLTVFTDVHVMTVTVEMGLSNVTSNVLYSLYNAV